MSNQKHHYYELAHKTAEHVMPFIEKYYRAEYYGLENIPDDNFLAVGNHLGVYFMPESYLWMGKYHLLGNKPPMKVLVHRMLHEAAKCFKITETEFGIVKASKRNAYEALKEGYSVTVYPAGDRDNAKPYKDRNKIDFFKNRGYIKMAIRTGVPILPVIGIGGGETLFVLSSGEKIAKRSRLLRKMQVHTWPVYWSFPFGLHVGHLPNISIPLPSQVTISVLPPIHLDEYTEEDLDNPDILEEINDKIVGAMQAEMDKHVKDRIPIIGKIKSRPNRALKNKK